MFITALGITAASRTQDAMRNKEKEFEEGLWHPYMESLVKSTTLPALLSPPRKESPLTEHNITYVHYDHQERCECESASCKKTACSMYVHTCMMYMCHACVYITITL